MDSSLVGLFLKEDKSEFKDARADLTKPESDGGCWGSVKYE
jgi:hypothetical protein